MTAKRWSPQAHTVATIMISDDAI